MIAIWADYNTNPSPAALRAAGFYGVNGYVGLGGAAKRLTPAKVAALRAAGLIVCGVFESTTTGADRGRAGGIADAHTTLADAAAAGLPVLYGTNDQPTWSQADVDYMAGAESVIGHDRFGVYGFGDFLARCHALGIGSYYWQAAKSPARTGTSNFVHLWQRNGTPGAASDGPATPTQISVGGYAVDVNNQYLPIPATASGDDDMTPDQDAKLTYLWQQLTQPFPSQVAGSTAALTLVDFCRAIDARTFVNLDAKTSSVLSAVNDQVDSLAAAVSKAQSSTPSDIAAAVLAAVAARLAA